jgi:hypothetical protein
MHRVQGDRVAHRTGHQLFVSASGDHIGRAGPERLVGVGRGERDDGHVRPLAHGPDRIRTLPVGWVGGEHDDIDAAVRESGEGAEQVVRPFHRGAGDVGNAGPNGEHVDRIRIRPHGR